MKIETVSAVGLGKMGSLIKQHIADTPLDMPGSDVVPNS